MQVQDTNDFSIGSKRSMCDAGYIKDDFIKVFCPKKYKRSPLINYGYCVRAIVLDYFLNFFKRQWNGHFYQVISLGAGYDTTFFRMFSDVTNVKYFEVDLSSVVTNKGENVLRNNCTKNLLNGIIGHIDGNLGIKSDNYVLLPLDLEHCNLEKDLEKVGMDFSVRTLIFSECAITYMDESKYAELIEKLSKIFRNSVFGVYEQACTSDEFGLFMMQHFQKLGTPLKGLSIHDKTDIFHRIDYFIAKGWSWCQGFSAIEVYSSCLDVSKQLDHAKTEPFDEWEELYLKSAHYALILAASLSMKDLCADFSFTIKMDQQYQERKKLFVEKCCLNLARYSHCSIPVGEKTLVIGGVDKAGRSTESLMLDKEFKSLKKIENSPALVNSAVVSIERGVLIFGGRLSPLKSVFTNPCTFSLDNFSLMPFPILSCDLPHPSARYRHSFVSTARGYCLFGGRNEQLQVFNDLWFLCEGSWIECHVSGPIPCPRFSHSSTTLPEYIYISGGLNSDLEPLNDIWCLHLDSMEWKEIAVPNLIPRFSHTSHLIGNQLILIGGVNKHHSSQPGVGVIDLESLKVNEMSLPACLDENSGDILLVYKHTSVISPCGKFIIILGGGGNCFSFGSHFSPCFRIRICDIIVS